MGLEIEAKLKVESPDEIAQRLIRLGAEFAAEQLHTDYYFDDAEGSLKAGDSALRLRIEQSGEKKRAILSYKGPKQGGAFKTREQIETAVSDSESIVDILLSLGYKQKLVFQKRRKVWRFGGCEVVLDELPLLGDFVEIEGPDETTIADIQEKLGLSDLKHISQSYSSLIRKKLKKLGIEKKEIFFQ